MGAPKGSSELLSQQYAFTVTLNPRLYNENSEIQYDNTSVRLLQKLSLISNNVTLVAELTKSCNIHYHGIIDFKIYNKEASLMRKFYDHFRCRHKNKHVCDCDFGFVHMKPIDNYPIWKDYITKSLTETRKAINRPPVLHDDFNMLPLGEFELYGFN